MRRFAALMHDHPWWVIGAWLTLITTLVIAARITGPEWRFDIEISGSESLEGAQLLNRHNSDQPQGDRLTLIWKSTDGAYSDQAGNVIEPLLADIADSANVASITNPFTLEPPARQALTSPSGDIATAIIELDQNALTIPRASVTDIVERVNAAGNDTVTIGLSGQSIDQTQTPQTTASEAIGIGFAAIILILAFGSILAAGLPLAGAIVALAGSASTVTLLTHHIAIPGFAPQLVALIGIGVGIDYALFVVARHRKGLLQGKTPRDALLEAMDSSGRAVLFAGVTVMIAILGLLVVGIGFLNGLAFAVTIGVAFTMAVTVTLMPALLGLLGPRVLGRRARRRLQQGPSDDDTSSRWATWSTTIQRRPWTAITIALAVLLLLTLPVGSMRLGNADDSTDAPGTVTRTAYDLTSEGFGPGANGPLLLVTAEQQPETLTGILTWAANHTSVAAVTPPSVSDDGQIAYSTIIPASGPQDTATSELIDDLRSHIAEAAPGSVYVTGATAIFYDFANDLRGKLPWFLLGVLGGSSILLLIAFRSIAIPVKAAVMNLLAAGATFGAVTAVFQWGWARDLIGLEKTGPIDAFLPVMLLAILFGLSMDYQVFLVSRMKEEWSRTRDNTQAVTVGLAETGRVITAAALIMIVVFTSFVFGGERIIKMFGFGLAVAIFLDAFLIRSLLVPALMQVLGNANWWLPKWLDKITPNISIEPSPDRPHPGSPDRSTHTAHTAHTAHTTHTTPTADGDLHGPPS